MRSLRSAALNVALLVTPVFINQYYCGLLPLSPVHSPAVKLKRHDIETRSRYYPDRLFR